MSSENTTSSTFTAAAKAAGSASISAQEAPLIMSVVDMVWPDQSNHHDTLFGGAALSILDRVAFMGASKVLRGSVVTASVGSMNFQAPAPAGHLVQCDAMVLRRGNRSVTLHLALLSEDLLSGKQTAALSGEFVMVRKEQVVDAQNVGAPRAACLSDLHNVQSTDQVTVAEIVFPGYANHRGILHGGPAMEWMAKAGFVAATRKVRRSVVLASSGQMNFKSPAYIGDMVQATAVVERVGKRSVHVRVEMWAESPVTGERRHCTSGNLVFVALPE